MLRDISPRRLNILRLHLCKVKKKQKAALGTVLFKDSSLCGNVTDRTESANTTLRSNIALHLFL